MKILIIGAGYLGLATGVFLRNKGHIVTGTTRSQDNLQELKDHLNDAILIEPRKLSQICQGQDVIVFTAAADNADAYKETYLENAKAIVEAFQNDPFIKQVIYSGSTSIYGDHQGGKVTEETTPAPLSLQGQILLETEKVLRQIPQSCIFRMGELIGPGRSIEERIRSANGAGFVGSGNSITNFSPLQDVIRAINFAIENQLTGIFNLCSTLHVPRKELYSQITQAKNLPLPTWTQSASIHSGNKIVMSDKLIQAGFKFECVPWEGILTFN